MSAISSVGQGLFQFTQSIQQNSPTSPPAAVPQATDADGGQAVQGGHHHGGHGGFIKKIEAAVTSALQSSQGSGSSDPNQAIQDAIAQVLGGGAANPAGSSTTAAATDPSTGSAAAQTNSAATSSQSAFLQTLQSYGIDPQQFKADFQAAIQSVHGNGGSSQTLPPGALVDQAA